MNYNSQLRGWAIDRVIEAKKAGLQMDMTLPLLKKYADDLAAYAYVPREDLQSTAKDLFDLVRNAAPNTASIDALIGTLERIREDRISQGIDTDEVAGAVSGEAA